MSVTEESHRRANGAPRVPRVARRHQIVILIGGRSVDQLEILVAQRTARKPFEIRPVFRRQRGANPGCGGARGGMVVVQRIAVGANFVVVAAHDRRDVAPRPVDDRIRIGAITGQIAQAGDAIVPAPRALKHRVERLLIPVNIADDQDGWHQDALRRNNATSGADPNRAGTTMVPMPRETKANEESFVYSPST